MPSQQNHNLSILCVALGPAETSPLAGSYQIHEPNLTNRNCCWNSLTTITRQRTNTFFDSSPEALPLCWSIMREVEAVAKAKGLAIPDGTVERLIKECTDVKTGLPSSMMADNFAGRPMEVEVILGTPMREGQRLGVDVKTVTALYVLVKALDYANLNKDKIQI